MAVERHPAEEGHADYSPVADMALFFQNGSYLDWRSIHVCFTLIRSLATSDYRERHRNVRSDEKFVLVMTEELMECNDIKLERHWAETSRLTRQGRQSETPLWTPSIGSSTFRTTTRRSTGLFEH